MPVGGARRAPLRTVSLLALLIALALATAAVWATYAGSRDQERRLLKERADEVGLVLQQSIDAIQPSLAQLGAILAATGESPSAFQAAAADTAAAAPGHPTFAWLRALPDGTFQVAGAVGARLAPLQIISDARAKSMTASMHTTKLVPTPVIGKDRILGFALGPPAAPGGTVLYRETALGPVVTQPRQTGTSPFSELDVALYASHVPDPATVLVSTTKKLPLRNGVRTVMLPVGTENWLLVVRARTPLVGRLTMDAPWIGLGVGIVGALLIAVVVETSARRRDTALSLYEAEHHVAETLQRSLLPPLPDLPGLELAARYLASGLGQQVGGDWFDVFPVAGGRVGVAIGDVVGHNVSAASAMAQIRALLRGYAIDGDPPPQVITRLGNAITALHLTQFVTVFYGLLEPAQADGSRALTYTNAGHLPPVLRHADGSVDSLSDGDSVVIGAPTDFAPRQGDQLLSGGSTLVLFTDGLVEVPGQSLTDGLRDLATSVEAQPDSAPEDLCTHLVTGVERRNRRDDVALLVVRLAAPMPAAPKNKPASVAGRGR